MRKTFLIAWREFRHTVLRPIFVIAIIGIPLLMLGMGAIAGVIMTTKKEPPLIGTVAIIEETGEVAEAAEIEFKQEEIRADEAREQEQQVEETMESLGTIQPMTGVPTSGTTAQRGEVRIEIEGSTDLEEDAVKILKDRVRDGSLLAVASIDVAVIEIPDTETPRDERPKFHVFAKADLDGDHLNLIERRIGEAIVRVRAQRANLDPDEAIAMLSRPRSERTRPGEDGGEASENRIASEIKRMMLPMAFMMLIWIGAFTSGQHLMLSTIEEKSNKVIEVLLSAVSPLQLMTGKILGYGAVGLLIVIIYSSLGIAAAIALATFSEFLTFMDLFYLAVFYIMAYFMIATLMAAVGSAVSDIREANTLVTPVMLVLMIPLILWMPISQDPNGPVAVVCSFIPPAIPFAMILRMVAEEPVPVWQIPLSIAWGYVCVLVMIWGAARIFRVGVLMTGKPPSPLELIKWMRYQ